MADEKDLKGMPQEMPGMPGEMSDKMPPPPPPGLQHLMEDDSIEVPNFLKQKNPGYWRTHPPVVMRGDAKVAFKAGAVADGMKCTCWNVRCPFYGDCRKCMVFHLALKQFPTCQREMVTELCLKDLIEVDMHIKRDEEGNVIESLITKNEKKD